MKLRIRALELRLSGGEIARQMGVVNSTVTAWLRGDREIPLDRVLELAALLKLPVTELLSPTVLAIVEAVERERQTKPEVSHRG